MASCGRSRWAPDAFSSNTLSQPAALSASTCASGFRDKGYLTSEKGHGGGWELACGLDAITLLDVYRAIGEPPLFSIGSHADHPECLVEQAVDARMDAALGEAEALLMARFGEITVADLADDFEQRLAGRPMPAGAVGVCSDSQ